MNFPKLSNTKLENEIVFVRGDLDVSIKEGKVEEDKRLQCVSATLKYLRSNGAYKVILGGHRGRPDGKPNPELSLYLLAAYFKEKLGEEVFFVPYELFDRFANGEFYDSRVGIYLLENLRFWEGEETNSLEFTQKLMSLNASTYINEAFASSHRTHASIVGLPEEMKKQGKKVFAGLQFAKEIDQLSQLLSNPKRPVISILSGVKKDKLEYVEPFKSFSDKVLISGRLPDFLGDRDSDRDREENIVVARLMPDKEDITLNSIEIFEKEIANAQTILVAGPIGKYEEEGHGQGTQRIMQAVAQSNAYKIAGGGDTEDAIRTLDLIDKFDWISVGGGAMLEFLAKGTLPGIDVLKV